MTKMRESTGGAYKPRYFHDAATKTVHCADAPRWSDEREKYSARRPHPELIGFNVYTIVRSMSARDGNSDKQLEHRYPSPRYSREEAEGLWSGGHMAVQIGGTEIEKDEYERLLAKYTNAYQAKKQRGGS